MNHWILFFWENLNTSNITRLFEFVMHFLFAHTTRVQNTRISFIAKIGNIIWRLNERRDRKPKYLYVNVLRGRQRRERENDKRWWGTMNGKANVSICKQTNRLDLLAHFTFRVDGHFLFSINLEIVALLFRFLSLSLSSPSLSIFNAYDDLRSKKNPSRGYNPMRMLVETQS